MSEGTSRPEQPNHDGWFGVALLAVIVGIEFAFPAWSTAQIYALAVAGAFFGAIIAWRTIRARA